MIDIELESELFKNHSRTDFPKNVTVIGSYHNYERTPPANDLRKLVSRSREWNTDISKLAVLTRNSQDIKTLESLLGLPGICLIGMGESGLVTRTEFPLKGSALTYGYLDKKAAPGQISAKELTRLLKAEE